MLLLFPVQNEWWAIREVKVGEGICELSGEEELYVRDKTATWSQGTAGHSLANNTGGEQAAGRTQVCSYTVDSAITHALWVNFIKPDKTQAGNINQHNPLVSAQDST